MPQADSYWSEAARAARGVAAVVVGDREVARYFNLTPPGLAGSFIAVLLITGIGAGLPILLGFPGRVLLSMVAVTLSFALQVGCAAVALAQAKRLDGFLPYLVVDNWATFYVTAAALALNLMGVGEEFIGFPLGVLIVIVAVNIGRLIVGLAPLQVAMFVIAQVVGYLIGGLLSAALLPVPAISS